MTGIGMFHGLMSSAPEPPEPQHLDPLLSPCSFCSWIEFGQSSSESVHRQRPQISRYQHSFLSLAALPALIQRCPYINMTCCELCHVEADRKCKTSPQTASQSQENRSWPGGLTALVTTFFRENQWTSMKILTYSDLRHPSGMGDTFNASLFPPPNFKWATLCSSLAAQQVCWAAGNWTELPNYGETFHEERST